LNLERLYEFFPDLTRSEVKLYAKSILVVDKAVDSQLYLAISALCQLEAVEVLPLSHFILLYYVTFKPLAIPRFFDFEVFESSTCSLRPRFLP
jgi:hypothetical protein